MSLPQAAYPLKVSIAPDSSGSPGSYAQLNGLNKAKFGTKQTLIDSTYFTGTGAKGEFPTLRDADCQLSGHLSPGAGSGIISADTAQETLFLSVGAADAYVWVQFFWTGSSHGFSLQMIVESFDFDAAVADVIPYSCSLKANSLPVYV